MMECEDSYHLFDHSTNATQAFLRSLERFGNFYQPIHGFICVFLCSFGLLTNAVHIAVLSRPCMRASAVNCLLTAVAVCDVGTMASYLVYIVHFVMRKNTSCSPTFTHGWMQFLMWHVVLSITLHTTSLWLAVAMAFLRRMTLRVARLNSIWQRPEFAWKVTLAIYIVVFLACTPNTMIHEIKVYDEHVWTPPPDCPASTPNATVYTFKISAYAAQNNCQFFKANIWMIGILFKVIPCFLLFVLSIGLMLRLREAESRRRKLTNCSATNGSAKKTKSTDRTTAMLIVILTVFLITELPQGALYVLSGMYTKDVHSYIYFYLGDVLDLMSLLNSSVNFILYCVMSSRYRKTFWMVLLPSNTYKWFMSRTKNNTTTNYGMSHVSRVPSTNNNKCRPAVDACSTPMNHHQKKMNNNVHEPLMTRKSDSEFQVRHCPDPLLNGSAQFRVLAKHKKVKQTSFSDPPTPKNLLSSTPDDISEEDEENLDECVHTLEEQE